MRTNDANTAKPQPSEIFVATMHSSGGHANANTGLQVAVSTDGVTFRNLRGNDESPVFTPANGMRDPIVLYRQGQWYLAYTYGPSMAPLVFVAKSPDLLRWTPVCALRLMADKANHTCETPTGGVVAVSGENNFIDVPQWIVDPAGNVHLIACTDHDHHWVEIHPLNNAPANWGDQSYWSAVTTLTDQDGKPLIQGNSFVALHNGTYYMAFNDINATGYYMRTSASLTSGWSAPRKLNIDSSVNQGDSENLVFLANGTLRFYISNGNFERKVIWYVDSADGGVTWTAPQPVEFKGFDREGVNWAQFVRITDPTAIAQVHRQAF
jgi:hypothetical protein